MATIALTPPVQAAHDKRAQYMTALERANEVRLARAALKRQVASGAISAGQVVLTCPPEADGLTIGELLESQHRWGTERARKLLEQISMKENKTLGSMTDRQRHVLAALV